jgi:hypothetical protein
MLHLINPVKTDRLYYDHEKELFVCVDCGAYAEDKDSVEHYPTCAPGTSNELKIFWDNVLGNESNTEFQIDPESMKAIIEAFSPMENLP